MQAIEMRKAKTELGRAVRAYVDSGKVSRPPGHEHHKTTNSLRDVILGGQDDLVNMLGIALGVIAAATSNRDTWVSTMMNEELHLQPVEQRSLVRSAVIVHIAGS